MTMIDDALHTAIQRLMGHSASPRTEAQSLLAHVLQVPRETLLAHPERVVSALDLHTFDHLLTLCVHGMPLPYLLGTRAFYDRVFHVNPAVLIPRPETELLVEQALRFARTLPEAATLRVIDIGTGSGVIAITLAAHLPRAQVIGTDVSAAALLVANANAEASPVVRNIKFVQADLWAPITGQFQIIASNLPYIATADLSILDVAHFEPHVALDGGNDGLMLIRKLLQTAPQRLATPGLFLIEHGADQGPAALALMQQAFPLDSVTLLKDDAGLDRAVRVERR
jgi:release factor glutamine methyltransferase